jgi:branched-chain amino acid transport system permease protein
MSNLEAVTFKEKYGSIGILLILLAIFPLVYYNRFLASEILIYGLYALSWDILFGHMGILSFGHAAFFGLGAYGSAIVSHYFHWPIIPSLAAGVVLAGVGSVIMGFIALQLRGMGLAIVTLAVAQILYFSGTQVGFIHYEDGLTAYRSDLNLGIFTLDLSSSLSFYYFVLFFVILSFLLIRKIINSPFGSVLHAIRENEQRSLTIGYPVFRYMFRAFVISGIFSGLSGSLFGMLVEFADLEYLNWHKSGQAVMITLVGGMRSLYGPLIGAGLMCMIEDVAAKYWMNWPIILGVVFILCVLFAKGGIWGGIEKIVGRFQAGLAQ